MFLILIVCIKLELSCYFQLTWEPKSYVFHLELYCWGKMPESVFMSYLLCLLQDALDIMGDKIQEAKGRWKAESTKIQEENKLLLLEFGLNPLDI